jgi:hypothetical protein
LEELTEAAAQKDYLKGRVDRPADNAVYRTVFTWFHGLINYKDIKAKCRHLKKLTCKGTSRQIFIRVIEIYGIMLVFSTQLGELLPLEPSLWMNSPLLPPFHV